MFCLARLAHGRAPPAPRCARRNWLLLMSIARGNLHRAQLFGSSIFTRLFPLSGQVLSFRGKWQFLWVLIVHA
jgi:hypothetical protein